MAYKEERTSRFSFDTVIKLYFSSDGIYTYAKISVGRKTKNRIINTDSKSVPTTRKRTI